MEPPAQIPCSGNCLVHLHSFSGYVWLVRRIYTLRQNLFPDGIIRFQFTRPNHPPIFLSHIDILTLHFQDRKAAMERLGHRAQNFVAIIPASSNTSRYQSQLSAGATAAGLNIRFFIEAPVLAASYYKSLTPGHRTVLVFDLDAHIFEVSLLTEDENLKVKAAVSNLGCPLLNYMVSEIQRKLGIDISGDATALHCIGQSCERAKDSISSGMAGVDLEFEQQGRKVPIRITRERLVLLNLRHLHIGIMRCLMQAGVRREAVDEIVLAGASATKPEVLEVLRQFFERQIFRCNIDPAKLIELSAMQYIRKVSMFKNFPMFGLRIVQSGIFTL
ncbi:heat shock 70 kDa protein-like [Dendrobium catenatum]|uniref:Heat shock 70 kDa protein n=1 Tax=Dendrobium catenatum TaxID=906689 RepID=A0A2I0WG51_9ASPA|nr:heat shock 70 kDa protein-like [Dendrobium catenatum]PKU74619.1 Heat shock 70 kDa protein [Dendrobium catenatum]